VTDDILVTVFHILVSNVYSGAYMICLNFYKIVKRYFLLSRMECVISHLIFEHY
jgi:hypothetical protein